MMLKVSLHESSMKVFLVEVSGSPGMGLSHDLIVLPLGLPSKRKLL